MYRIARLKSTGKLIEMQSGGKVEIRPKNDAISDKEYEVYLTASSALEDARLDTLRKNAINAGYDEKDIEVKWVTEAEWAAIRAIIDQPTAEQIAEQEKEVLIQAKMREMAEAELIKEGKGKLTAAAK